MPLWIRVVCKRPLGEVHAKDLQGGIGDWIYAMAARYGQDDDDEPEASWSRVRVTEDPRGFRVTYRDASPPLFVERRSADAARTDLRELGATVAGRPGSRPAEEIREQLASAAEVLAFALEPAHHDDMGWALGMSAAAWAADRADGLICADGEGWLSIGDDGPLLVLPD